MLPLIIEPAQLAQELSNPKLLLIDLCNEQTYHAGHIPNAHSVLPQEIMAGTPPAVGKQPDEARLTALFSRLGLTAEHHVVVYDDEGGGWAGRMIWLLDVIGHQKYSYLNGGLLAWKAENRDLTDAMPQPQPVPYKLYVNHQFTVDIEDILPQLGNKDFVVWDARSPAEYRGEKVFAQKAGHIPGAINCEWTQLMDQQRQLRIRDDAKTLLANLGIDRSKTIITHCQTHHRSGFTYLVGKTLGFSIRAYSGSWSEWGNHPDTPVDV
ncbi:rhodanese-like domain-containing protein [Simiduia curdlanivorans]|uniref:Sulfurtransferase n=1 Tax=Simiduia curdlanivorans TaxID=1492769 RepID=A0ABV8V4V0_9GAMM|nr:rhodanese-like domain-containing protein [Simiduia curdlanivorans]MDN3637284.1 rhodanese-like domain-containing protein [Simiduia curdlanivorans]